jgi:hypothetical protein
VSEKLESVELKQYIVRRRWSYLIRRRRGVFIFNNM